MNSFICCDKHHSQKQLERKGCVSSLQHEIHHPGKSRQEPRASFRDGDHGGVLLAACSPWLVQPTFFGWFFCLFLKQGFLCVALAVLELTLSARLALNSLCFPSARIKGICHHHPTQTAFLQHPDLQPRGGTILSELDPLTSITNQENAPPAKLVGAFS